MEKKNLQSELNPVYWEKANRAEKILIAPMGLIAMTKGAYEIGGLKHAIERTFTGAYEILEDIIYQN